MELMDPVLGKTKWRLRSDCFWDSASAQSSRWRMKRKCSPARRTGGTEEGSVGADAERATHTEEGRLTPKASTYREDQSLRWACLPSPPHHQKDNREPDQRRHEKARLNTQEPQHEDRIVFTKKKPNQASIDEQPLQSVEVQDGNLYQPADKCAQRRNQTNQPSTNNIYRVWRFKAVTQMT